MIFSEPVFTNDEMLLLTKDQLRKILEFLGVSFELKDTKSSLISKLQEYNKVNIQPNGADILSEPPRYSVRVKAIMERKEREKNDS